MCIFMKKRSIIIFSRLSGKSKNKNGCKREECSRVKGGQEPWSLL